MAGLIRQLTNICEDLEHIKVPWALVGALAVGVHVEPRNTRDIDLAIAIADKTKQDALVKALIAKGYGEPQVLMHLLPTHSLGIRLQARDGGEYPVAIDLLFSSSGIEQEIVAASIRLEILPGFSIPVATRGHLIAMKVVSKDSEDRLRDESDLRQLLKGATTDDIKMAHQALDLITKRQFNRGKDLFGEFEAVLKQFPSFRRNSP